MIAQVFAVIQLVLAAIGLWDQFSAWTIAKAEADREQRRQDRDKAVDNEQNAQTEDEFDKAQDALTHNLPKP